MTNVSMEELMQKTGNIYEAVAVVARRARQINNMQKQLLDKDRDTMPVIDLRESEDFEDVEIDREALNREYKKLPKPTRVAMEQMRDGLVLYRYKTEEEK